jgi:hypothetical protein
MPKAYLSFNLPEETEEFQMAQRAINYKIALEDIYNRVFRPAFKHGYANQELNKLSNTKSGQRLIELLTEEYRAVMEENNAYD